MQPKQSIVYRRNFFSLFFIFSFFGLMILLFFSASKLAATFQSFDMLIVYRGVLGEIRRNFWFNWAEDLMNVRPHLSVLFFKQQLMISLALPLPPSLPSSLSLSISHSSSPLCPLFFLPLTALITRGPRAPSDGPWLHRCHSVPLPLSTRVAPQPELAQRTQPLQATTSPNLKGWSTCCHR